MTNEKQLTMIGDEELEAVSGAHGHYHKKKQPTYEITIGDVSVSDNSGGTNTGVVFNF